MKLLDRYDVMLLLGLFIGAFVTEGDSWWGKLLYIGLMALGLAILNHVVGRIDD